MLKHAESTFYGRHWDRNQTMLATNPRPPIRQQGPNNQYTLSYSIRRSGFCSPNAR